MFYINPPKGKVALYILENSVFTRLEYLRLLEHDKTDSFSGNFEYLLENSMCDSIGHFTLRLIAAASQDLWPFWVRSEELLLKQRLDHLSIRQVHRLFRNITRHLNRRDCDDTPVSNALIEMSKHFLKPQVFHHIVKENHADDCRKYQCQVPFSAIPDLVKRRKIDLYRGNGTVVCSEWKIVLLCLYRNFIIEEKKRISYAEYLVSTDPRLIYISKTIHGRALDKLPARGNITAKNINAESRKFPPCMQNLHAILREKHRLSHHARFNYSLFLKECGMKLEDAIVYWREEYTKPHTCQSGCTHNWQTDERKFLYSIRHLYGLEGGRKNYKTPNCKMICNDVPGLRYEGGCPFKQFDADKLGKLLRSSMNESEVQERMNNLMVQKPEVACSEWLKIIHKRDGQDIVVHSPVQYYTQVTSETK